ncbi:aldehyde dehydrogenase [Flavihumibacter petaseus]|uniref:Aldehyde dehydrogenase n=1 Tax=Flavihumibacter petaseus NBRC 106054 TaxID=1220578 RepID=A0A0E9N6C1_9BACT|nr:aldehyde dehydrogenase [Flavihumibacter petaseus]GAO45487.1 aldehyde dehydrogenase [Flavihumibacter petaseus NBRC 106054]
MNDFAAMSELHVLRNFYESGATRPYEFRKQQLLLLKAAVLKYEQEIYVALHTDLKKSAEEAYATESGLVLAEINLALRQLRRWMKPRRILPDLVNLPSSGRIHADPLGVVLIIAPWNYPLQLCLIPLVGAIAAGNCAVLKPSELAPATSAIIQKIISEIYPPAYIKVVEGDGSVVIPEMMQQFRFDHVFYTGSIPVGKIIYQLAAKTLTPVTLELGGKSPAIVEKDADITVSTRRIVLGKFANAGQTCVAPDYVLVHEDIAEAFTRKLVQTIQDFFGKDAQKSADYGKIINARRFDQLASYLKDGELVYGGKTDRTSLYFSPTVLKNITAGSAIMTDEIFGPVLPILTFSTTEEAAAIVRQHPDPLAFYLFTSDKVKEKTWLDQTRFGGGCVNNTVWHFANHRFPFGGIGNSGIGAYHGKHSFNTFSHEKAVMKTPLWLDPAIKYPPFKGKLKWFKRFIR